MPMIGVKQIFSWAGGCVLASQFFMKWSPLFLAVLCRPNTFWSMYPGTLYCTQMLRIAIHCYRYKDFNHRCKDGYVLGKTPVSLLHYYGLFAAPDIRPVLARKDSRIRNDRAKLHELALDPIHSWPTEADSCPPSDFSDRPPISISMTTGRKWLTWNRSIIGSAEALPILCVRCFRWERERERERERRKWVRRKWRHHCRAKIGDEFTLSLAKNSHNWRWVYTFPCQKLALFVSPFTLPVSPFTERSPLWRWNSQWVHTFHCQKMFRPLCSSLSNGTSRATSDRKPKTNDQILLSPIIGSAEARPILCVRCARWEREREREREREEIQRQTEVTSPLSR